MKTFFKRAFFQAALGLSTAVVASQMSFGGTPANPQAPERPFGLSIISYVQVAKSDAEASSFYNTHIAALRQIINANLSESVKVSNVSSFKLDANKLFLRQQANKPIRVYFLAEGAGYRNSLGFAFTPAGSETSGQPYLIFPDASSGSKRGKSAPVMEGDFVEIGRGGNGYQLDFFVISDGANGGKTWLWNDIDKNSDRLQHVVAYHVPNTSLILIGFEDIVGGGDLDYNDCLFVVDIGFENIEALYPH
jgi:hypothetical protein